jgi:hypothetical protein
VVRGLKGCKGGAFAVARKFWVVESYLGGALVEALSPG